MKHCILIRASKVPLWQQVLQSARNCRLLLVFLWPLVFGLSGFAADDPNSSIVIPDELKDVPRFVKELSAPDAPVLSRFLWAQFSEKDQQVLKDAKADKEQKSVLVTGLNEIIAGRLLYDEESFTGVKLSPETLRLAQHAQYSQDGDIARLNRLLLEDTYPRYLKQIARVSPIPPAVYLVARHGADGQSRDKPMQYAQRSDDIYLDAYNLDRWLSELKAKGRLPAKHEIKDLVPYVDHLPLAGVHPNYGYEWPDYKVEEREGRNGWFRNTVTTVGFTLARTEESKAAWSHILSQPVLQRRVVVSLGFDNGEEMDSILKADGKKEQERFYLTVIPYRTGFGVVIILGALLAFLSLACHTHIIRDATAPRRPDGLRPYSLARAQMAFWFFLVIASYSFLWIVTGDMDTLNTSVLGLIGISAGTALGAAFVDAGKPVSGGTSGNEPTVDVTKPHLEVVEELNKLRLDTVKELEALQKARALLASTDKQVLEENERQQNEVRERLANYKWQTAYFAWPQWKGVMYDLLAENNLISFHRFQMFVWTLVLGIMFVWNVYNDLAMPQFSATMLGLLGISAGTYIGFKLPETKTQ